jgi:hypothetical protein
MRVFALMWRRHPEHACGDKVKRQIEFSLVEVHVITSFTPLRQHATSERLR